MVPPAVPTGSTHMATNLKAQQEKQRQELLAHAQSFLNPQNKPSIKQTGKVEVSASDKKPGSQSGGSSTGGSNFTQMCNRSVLHKSSICFLSIKVTLYIIHNKRQKLTVNM
jgi:hypothetical protein